MILMPGSCLLQPSPLGPKPGRRIFIYSAERAGSKFANGLSRCRCPPFCTQTVSDASGAVAKLVSAGAVPGLR
jgi:hypothetical protein